MSHLKLTDVSKDYGHVQVLKHINLDIVSGEFMVFVGPSGSGKSTLLRTIAGLETITGGTLESDGEVSLVQTMPRLPLHAATAVVSK